MPLELKKVINTELLDISVASASAQTVRARVENSHGILKDCFQQSVVQLAQAFDPKVAGRDIFPDFGRAASSRWRCATRCASWSRSCAPSRCASDPAAVPALKEESRASTTRA